MKLSEYFRLHPEAWVKRMGDEHKCGCLITAPINLKIDVRDGYPARIRESMAKLFPDRIKNTGKSIVYFNDHPETTLSDVIKVLEDAGE